jgi:hypothetical protein
MNLAQKPIKVAFMAILLCCCCAATLHSHIENPKQNAKCEFFPENKEELRPD